MPGVKRGIAAVGKGLLEPLQSDADDLEETVQVAETQHVLPRPRAEACKDLPRHLLQVPAAARCIEGGHEDELVHKLLQSEAQLCEKPAHVSESELVGLPDDALQHQVAKHPAHNGAARPPLKQCLRRLVVFEPAPDIIVHAADNDGWPVGHAGLASPVLVQHGEPRAYGPLEGAGHQREARHGDVRKPPQGEQHLALGQRFAQHLQGPTRAAARAQLPRLRATAGGQAVAERAVLLPEAFVAELQGRKLL
mmetsp:Transcript_22351/g.69268  ORF Transcript_22351/g.69268 Transcript_22351/m.69268 type:complete len:251 (+) Transcript_22351:1286-2038(+)